MNLLYVTSTIPGSGKTLLSLTLAQERIRQNEKVGYFKLFWDTPNSDSDAEFGYKLTDESSQNAVPTLKVMTINEMLDGNEDDVVNLAVDNISKASQTFETLIIEGPSISMGGRDLTDISRKVIEQSDARGVIVISGANGLGNIDWLGLNKNFGGCLSAVLLNSITRYRFNETVRVVNGQLQESEMKLLGVIPEDRRLLAVTMLDIGSYLNARWINGYDDSHDLIYNFLIGGNIMDSGATYFGGIDNKVVVVRGDRPDIQLAALATPTRGLILTGGIEPVEYVKHEALALDVPMIIVDSTTLETVEALGGLLEIAHSHHLEKTEVFRDLLFSKSSGMKVSDLFS